MDNAVDYQKMSRNVGTLFAHHRLWKAEDHLLVVKQLGPIEEYKRFYFSDIQSIVIARSPKFKVLGWLLSILALLMFGIASASENRAFPLVFGIFLSVFWIIHVIKGPTCACWINTEINQEKLRMFRRVSAADKFLNWVRPLLEAAQGSFALEQMEAEAERPVVEPQKTPPPLPSMTLGVTE